MKTEADALRKKATELKEEADLLSEEVDDILKKLEALERQAREDETVIKDVSPTWRYIDVSLLPLIIAKHVSNCAYFN